MGTLVYRNPDQDFSVPMTDGELDIGPEEREMLNRLALCHSRLIEIGAYYKVDWNPEGGVHNQFTIRACLGHPLGFFSETIDTAWERVRPYVVEQLRRSCANKLVPGETVPFSNFVKCDQEGFPIFTVRSLACR